MPPVAVMGTLFRVNESRFGEYAHGYARGVPDGTVAIEDYASVIDILSI